MNSSFTEALRNNDLKALRKVPKSDLHNHCMMGSRLKMAEKLYGKKIRRFTSGNKGIAGINHWIGSELRPVLETPGMFEKLVEAAFLQAKSDGVTVLEMSMDIYFGQIFNIKTDRIIATLGNFHKAIAPEIDFRPEIGMSRNLPIRIILSCLGPFLESGFFRSIDLYDLEFAQPNANFKEIYRMAKSSGLKCKAHTGEFGSAEHVRETVEVLDLDEVQHGIGAALSPEVMKWLTQRKIRLNVCPASNVALKCARSYKVHPIRILYDHGVKVTVNTDDVMLFNRGNSEQFLQLHRSGAFSPEELDEIRLNGLNG
jgi:adenosine deaminase